MRVSVEMDDRGRIRVESDQDQLDVAEAAFLLDMGKMYIQSEWARSMEERHDGESEPESEPHIAEE